MICCAHGCRNRYGERPGLGFFRFPMQHGERKKRWILAVRRKSWNPTKHTRICGDRFVSGERIHGACSTEITRQYCCSGKPVEEPESVDYVPSIISYNQHRRDNEAQRREQIDGGRYLKSLKLRRKTKYWKNRGRRKVMMQLWKVYCFCNNCPR